MKFIIKADDLAGYPGIGGIPKRWKKFVNIIEKHNIKATIGIIGNSLIFDDKEYFDFVKKYNNNLIEFWNHGFLHRQFNFDGKKYQEFNQTSIDYQYNLISYTNKLAKEKLNIEFLTFGAPYNAVDYNTSTALEKSNIKNCFFCKENFKGRNLLNRIEIEYPVHKPNYKEFKNNFKVLDYAVFQIHPNSWDDNLFKEFESIILFLKDKGEFIFAKDL